MHTEFIARRAVTILGVDYQPGAVIDDTSIPPGVLATLTSTRRIAQRIRNDNGTLVEENARFPIDQTGARALPPVTAIPQASVPVFQPTRHPEPDPAPQEPQEPPGGPIGDPVPQSPPGDPYEPEHGSVDVGTRYEGEIDPLPWRAAWQAGVSIRPGFTGTFRAYLQARCGGAGLTTSGAVTDLLIRLTETGVQPVPPVATMRPRGTGKSAGRARKERGATP